ncbi:Maf-like protein [Parasponia andersonii]|uniref:Maf-like protein n=1 Tax=Parasponia andersonii TaxID=3476 RepID=A0A2P5AWH1_PARAD|nr:Maf-like protein [Parasponia andersonii]
MAANCSPFKIILGSSSIARRKILAEMGYDFTIMTADIDEKSIRKENPEDLVVTLAEAKADAIVSKLQTFDNQNKDDKPTILIAADTSFAPKMAQRGAPTAPQMLRQNGDELQYCVINSVAL